MKDPEETKALVFVGKGLKPKAPSLEETLRSMQIFIPPAAPGPDGIWVTPFSVFAEFFKKQSFPPVYIQLALINLVVLISAHLGNPIVLEIIDDVSAGAADLVQRCMDLAPRSFWEPFLEMSLDDLVKSRENIKGKTIVGSDSAGFEKGKETLNLFLANQKLTDQRTVLTKIGNVPVTTVIVGPTGCVLISKNPKKLILTHPSFLGIEFKPITQGFYAPELEERAKAQLELHRDWIRESLQRLKENPVRIPFWPDIVQHLQADPSARAKGEMLRRMLKDVTIINNSPHMTESEIYSLVLKSNPATVALAKGLTAIPQGVLVARKVDYYILCVLLSGMLRIEGVSFSERERRIFRVVKDFNEGALGTSFMPPNATKFDKLAQIPKSPFTWPDQEEIFERVNRDGGEEVGSTSTVYSDLQDLEKKGVIKNAKNPNGRQHGYYVTTWELSDTISLPDPKDVEDPYTGKEPIKVRNPITGEVDVV